MKNMTYTTHARERCKERDISKKPIDIEQIKKMPVYTTENGCTKYLDVSNLIDPNMDGLVYYVRGRKIVTMIRTNPLQMARYYCYSKNINFNDICRDNIYNNCKRGHNCKYRHLEINVR